MPPRPRKKNAAAVELGRRGGLARGKTVLETISPAKRSMYARHASLARWAQVRAAKKAQENKV